jgi:hypothetical protein
MPSSPLHPKKNPFEKGKENPNPTFPFLKRKTNPCERKKKP